MKKVKNLIINIDEGKYTAKEIVLSGVILFLLGILIGMLCSPRKNQVFGSFNGNSPENATKEIE